MQEEGENNQIIPESNIVYTNNINPGLRNQDGTCSFSSTLQVLCSCERIAEWVADYPFEDVQLKNASFREIFGWRVLRTLQDILAMQLNRLMDQGQLNIHSSRFSLPSCMDRDPEVDSWAQQSSLSPGTSQFVNWVDNGVVCPNELLRSAQKEPWTYEIQQGQSIGQNVASVIISMFDAISYMEDNDVLIEELKKYQSHSINFRQLAYGSVTFRRTCTKSDCTLDETFVQRWRRASITLIQDSTLEESIHQGFKTWDVGDGLNCPYCHGYGCIKAGEVKFQIAPVLAIQLDSLPYKDDAESEGRDYELWEALNQPIHLYNGPIDQPDNEKQWMAYRISGVISRRMWKTGGAHVIAYLNRYMEGRGPTWSICDDEQMDLLRPDELADHSSDRTRINVRREIPQVLIYELEKPSYC